MEWETRYTAMIQSVRSEFANWRDSPAGKGHGAAWWNQVVECLDKIAATENDPASVSRDFLRLQYVLMEFGPFTKEDILAIAPTMAELRTAIRDETR